MLVSQIPFREIQYHYFLLPLQPEDTVLYKICKHFPGAAKANLVLLYGYIDHQAGITFELLCNGILKGNQVSLYDGTDDFTAKIRSGEIAHHEIYPQEEYHFAPYQEKVDFINTNYKVSKDVETLRSFTELDPFRHPLYPDDLGVILYREGQQMERCWVRCNAMKEDGISGTLLNEPNGSLGPHCSDEITFTMIENKDKTLLPICYLEK